MPSDDTPVPKLDHDIGYLVRSPCRDCETYGSFPECMDDCIVLDRVQTAVSRSLSSTHRHSTVEGFTLGLDVLERV